MSEENKVEAAPAVASEAVVAPVAAAVEAPAAPVGTDDLKAVLDLVVDAVKVGQSAMADGKIGLTDLPLLIGLVPDLIPAVSGLSKVPAELSDLTEAEAADVVAHVMTKLALGDGKAKDVVSASLKVLVGVVALIEALKA